eukprot:gene1077-4308_t
MLVRHITIIVVTAIFILSNASEDRIPKPTPKGGDTTEALSEIETFQKLEFFYKPRASLSNTHFWRQRLLYPAAPYRSTKWRLFSFGGSQFRRTMSFFCNILDESFRSGTKSNGKNSNRFSCNGNWGAVELHMKFVLASVDAIKTWKPENDGTPAAVLFDGAGLDILHALPHRKWRYFSLWNDYKDHLREAVTKLDHLNVPAIFLTTGSVCINRLPEDLKWTAQYCKERSQTLLKACEVDLKHKLTRLRIDNACFEGCLNEENAERLFKQELSVLAFNSNVHKVNVHTISKQQCWATADGISFPPLVPMVLTEILGSLKDIIESWYNAF